MPRSDEFVHVLSSEVILVTDAGEELLCAGDAADFKAGDRNGHCLQNRSYRPTLALTGMRAGLAGGGTQNMPLIPVGACAD